MRSSAEKRYNARINVWLRSPGLLCCAFAGWTAAPPTVHHSFFLGLLFCAINGQYYMQMVVGNTFLKSRDGTEAGGPDAYNC